MLKMKPKWNESQAMKAWLNENLLVLDNLAKASAAAHAAVLAYKNADHNDKESLDRLDDDQDHAVKLAIHYGEQLKALEEVVSRHDTKKEILTAAAEYDAEYYPVNLN